MSPRRSAFAVVTLSASAALALSACGSSSKTTAPPATTAPTTAPTTAAVATTGAPADTSAPTTGAADTGTATASSGPVTCGSGSLKAAGSTFQANFEAQAIKDYTAACPGAAVDYQGTGSGAGIASFGTGQIDFAGSDALMSATDQTTADKQCSGGKAIHIPLTAGAVVFTYNLSGFTGNLQLDPTVIAGIYTGKITTWDDAAIKADNPGADLPSTDITPIYRNDSSGTTSIVSNYETAAAGAAWTLGVGKDITFPGGQGAKGSDGVTNAVKSTDGGITYTELSYAVSNQLKTVAIKNASGAYVTPSGAAASAALATAKVDTSMGDARVTPDYVSSNAAAYPVSAPTYIITCSKGSKQAAAIKAYLTFATTTEQAKADSVGYAPLPAAIAAADAPLVAAIS